MVPLFRDVMKKLESLIKESRLPIQLEESDLSLPVGGFFIDFRKHAEASTNQKPDEVDSVNYQLSTSPPIVTAMLNHQIMFSYKFEGSTSEMAWKLFGDVEKMFIQGTEATQSSMLASAVID